MGSKRKAPLAFVVLALVYVLPLGASAQAPTSCAGGPAPVGAAPHYSPWHYRTPLLYRCWAERYYGVRAGMCGPGCYAPPTSGTESPPNTTPAAASPDAKERPEGP